MTAVATKSRPRSRRRMPAPACRCTSTRVSLTNPRHARRLSLLCRQRPATLRRQGPGHSPAVARAFLGRPRVGRGKLTSPSRSGTSAGSKPPARSAPAQEAALVKQLQPGHNRASAPERRQLHVTLVHDGEGWRPELVLASGLDFGAAPRLIGGLFKSAREAGERSAPWPPTVNPCDGAAGSGKDRARQALLRLPDPPLPCWDRQLSHSPSTPAPGRRPGPAQARLLALRRSGADPRRRRADLIDGWRYLGTARSDEELRPCSMPAAPS